MRLQAFFALLIVQDCSAQNDINMQEKILKKINTLTEEVTVLKNQDIDKESRIQALESKVVLFEQDAEHKDGIIENLLNQVDNLQIQINETNIEISQQVDMLKNQINETNIEIGQHANQFESHEQEFQGTLNTYLVGIPSGHTNCI